MNVEVLRAVLTGAGFQVLKGEDLGDPSGKAWAEYGDLDQCGHTFGCAIARQAEGELKAIANRVLSLLDDGWQQVIVVTDHGWLLLPGGLPKAELPEHLTVIRKGRCARLKDMAQTDQQDRALAWGRASADRAGAGHPLLRGRQGIRARRPQPAGMRGAGDYRQAGDPRIRVATESVAWSGMRCRVALSGTAPGISVDIRTAPANASTSIAQSARPV